MAKKRKSFESTVHSSEDRIDTSKSLRCVAPSVIADGTRELPDHTPVKWSWACRHLMEEGAEQRYCLQSDTSRPRPADVALVRVEKIGHHRHIETAWERRLRLYTGDRLTCIFGNRYATDVYEGRVLDSKKLHLLTGSGVIGTVVARHRDIERPTALSFLGYLADPSGARVNLKELHFPASESRVPEADLIVVLGTGMNTGKTTVTRKILRALVANGVRAAGCKLTGTASPRDLHEMRATGAVLATDFSDYGFPSTYGASLEELLQLFACMLDACSRKEAHLVVAEVADGFLQRETQMLLDSKAFRRRVQGVVLAGACSGSALYAADYIQNAGLEVWGVSGVITNSPLFVREFSSRSPIPVISSRTDGDWANILMKRIALKKPEEARWQAAAEVDY